MIVQVFPKLKNFLPVRLLREFFLSRIYLVLIGLLMTLGELLAIELAVFWCDIILGALALLFADDTLATVPIACCGYMTIAAKNNTIFAEREGRTTVFRDPAFQIQLAFILIVGVALLLGRLATLLIENRRRAGAPKLAMGFFALGAAYMLGGGGSSHYSGRTVLFGFVQIASLAFFYLYYHYTVNWKETPKDYTATMFFVIGLFVSVQVFGMYRNAGVFLPDGAVDRTALYAGWGTYNNVGGVMAMCIPAPFYFAATRKRGALYIFPALYLLLSTCLTQSRGSMLFGTVVFSVCALWALSKKQGRERLVFFLLCMGIIAAVSLALIVFRGRIDALYASVLEAGTDDSSRFTIWKNCIAAFRKNPFLGVGFYDTPGFGFEYNVDHSAFIPARAHNTYIQLLSTGGIVLLAAYLFHRAQTLKLLLTRRSPEKSFALLVALALILTSLVDCHFFNIGPGILYGVVLSFAEGTEEAERANVHALLRACPALRAR